MKWLPDEFKEIIFVITAFGTFVCVIGFMIIGLIKFGTWVL